MNNKVIKQKLKKVENFTGSGTSCISLYIPAGKNIQSVQSRISQEKSEAQNIKSDSNRKKVENSISRVNKILKNYKKTPENGLVIFVGIDNNQDIFEVVFDDLESELQYSDYNCDSRFETEPIKQIISPDKKIGLLVIERGGSVIGELVGNNIIVHTDNRSNIMGKHKAGGQSSIRFDRLIEEEKHEFFKKTRNKLKSLFLNKNNRPEVDSFIIGGTTITVEDFISNNYIPKSLEEIRIKNTYSIDLSNKQSLEQLVSLAKNEINTIVNQEERKMTERFFKSLHTKELDGAYGKNEIDKALNYGSIEYLLVSDKKDPDLIEEYTEKVENKGGKVIIVSTDFEKGKQLYEVFDGLAAILRFPIN